jgi:hypothetical protein
MGALITVLAGAVPTSSPSEISQAWLNVAITLPILFLTLGILAILVIGAQLVWGDAEFGPLAIFDKTWSEATWNIFLLDMLSLVILVCGGSFLVVRQPSVLRARRVVARVLLFYYGVLKAVFHVDILDTFPCSLSSNECRLNIFSVLCIRFAIVIMSLGSLIAMSVTVRNLRRSVRAKCGIPSDLPDCFYSTVCPRLTLAQLLRHTTDYNTVEATFCSGRGFRGNDPREVELASRGTEQQNLANP